MSYWLMKSEPTVFSIDDLARVRVTPWEGVRNYQARNFMRDGMRKGDLAFLYHSSCEVPGIMGVMEIGREAYPDPSQFDPGSPYFDPASRPDDPRWLMVDVRYRRRLPRAITLAELRTHRELAALALLRRGNRLSIMPVTGKQWQFILALA
ncbi:MAG: EVE domain-containing protein [Gammaproteobacteria bacterium]|nr:EVE domain-containing protein [Gammaproteobacteria bacterium]